jgi:hypothetical protein
MRIQSIARASVIVVGVLLALAWACTAQARPVARRIRATRSDAYGSTPRPRLEGRSGGLSIATARRDRRRCVPLRFGVPRVSGAAADYRDSENRLVLRLGCTRVGSPDSALPVGRDPSLGWRTPRSWVTPQRTATTPTGRLATSWCSRAPAWQLQSAPHERAQLCGVRPLPLVALLTVGC